MDFHGLIYAAHKNEVTKDKSKARCYPSSFAPPKKEEKSKGLSVNVKRFLARKEEEEKKRKVEEERKREALLQLRNQDNKAKKRVQVMLKRTKSYNKSVLEDAIDDINTADTMNGPQQCDEDDYGYVSQEASALYSKMMEKYGSVPADDHKFSKKGKSLSSDLLGTKDRVKMALQRQEEEELGPHKRKRKKKDEDSKDDIEPDDEPRIRDEPRPSLDKYQGKEKEKEEKSKPKRPPAPPPLDFSELLKMAEKKQYEPPPLEIKLKEAQRQQQAKRQQQREPERLMTKKEKLEYERSRDKRLQREPGISNDSRRENNLKSDNKQDRKEKDREDERKRMKEQRIREEERKRRQREEEREQERRRQEDREQERRRQEDREQERRRQEDREQERRREEDKERQRERDRIRELEEELARRKERERMREEEVERRERNKKSQPVPKKTDGRSITKSSSLSSSKPGEVPGKSSKSLKSNSEKPVSSKDYRNGDAKKKSVSGSEKIHSLFGETRCASPGRSSLKTEKPKPRPVERIKVSSAAATSVDDLFGDDVTIRTKQKPVPNSGNNKVLPKSNDKPSSSLKPRDDPKKEKLSIDRKRPAEMNGKDYPEKRQRPGDPRSADRTALSGRLPIKKEFPPRDLKPRQFPPADVRSRQFPPADVRSRQFPPSDVARKGPMSNRHYEYEREDSADSSDEDEDDEYDSELDDFIDDGPEEVEEDYSSNYSKYIKDIFGYDKTRYANIDDRDDRCMESNYAQVMREEKTSARIGLLEDIEDMKKEEMEKRLKAMRKVKPARR